jgi:hypothetical protein
MPTLDRMREKHNDLVKQLTKAIAKKDKTLDALIRAEAKVRSLIKAVARSQKRLDKARSLAALNAGPVDRSKPLDLGALTPEQADKVIASEPLPVFDMPDIPVELRREPKAKPSVSLADLHKTEQGKANAESWNAIPAIAKGRRKSRRTPDDFAADMAAKKGSATRGRIAD